MGAPAKAKPLVGDRSALLAPCQNSTYAPCVAAGIFFARWARTDADEVVFSFNAFSEQGELAMAQGLGIVRSDGSGARILTHDPDACPYGPCNFTHQPSD